MYTVFVNFDKFAELIIISKLVVIMKWIARHRTYILRVKMTWHKIVYISYLLKSNFVNAGKSSRQDPSDIFFCLSLSSSINL